MDLFCFLVEKDTVTNEGFFESQNRLHRNVMYKGGQG